MDNVINFLRLVLLSMVPFILAGQGTMLGGRTGVFNVAQEGMMLVGASIGFLVSYSTGSLFLGIDRCHDLRLSFWPGAGLFHNLTENGPVRHWTGVIFHWRWHINFAAQNHDRDHT